MRKMLIVALLLIAGCSNMKEGEEKQQTKTVTERRVLGAIDLTYAPSATLGNDPPVVIEIFGEKIKVPKNAKINLTFKTQREKVQKEWYEYIGTFKASKKLVALLITGAFCLAGGAALMFFGSWKIGGAMMTFGLCLIACGVAIDKYPWVFLIVLGLIIVGLGFLIYQLIDKHWQTVAFGGVVDQIDVYKQINPAEAQTHILDPLAKHNDVKTIKKHVRRLRD